MRIIIDPGHGDDKPGAVYSGVAEKDINLAVALAMGRMLRDKGHQVLYTRDRDVNLSLMSRVNMINEFKADVFISIHCNASVDHKSNGVEAYYRDALDYGLANTIQQALAARTGLKDRGTHKDILALHKRLTVLDNSEKVPAALIELGFLDSPDLAYLTGNINTVAEIMADAVHDYAVKRGMA